MPIRRPHPPRAFTLIELLVVVAIIALLISILLPSLSQAKRQARRTQCAAQLHDIGISLMSYYNDYGRLPHQNTAGSSTRREERLAVALWAYSVHEEIASHMGGLQVATENIETGELTRTHPVFYCPLVPANNVTFSDVLSGPGTGHGIEATEDVYLHIGYAYYGRLDECANDPARPENQPADGIIDDTELYYLKRQRYADRTPTADDVIMADTIQYWGGGQEWRINHGVGWGYKSSVMAAVPELRGANELFGDGHVEWRGTQHFPELLKASAAQRLRQHTLVSGADRWWW